MKARVALLLVLLVCAVKAVRLQFNVSMDDFKVYYTAAALVREHRSPLIYDGADTGADPQLRFADPGSAFGREAQRLGIPSVRMYVYPPVLADLLVPFSYLPIARASALWMAVNALTLGAFCCMTISVLDLRWRNGAAFAVVVSVLTFFPVAVCLSFGQIVILLLGLWTLGVFCYARGWKAGSAVALALATAIKLTPLLVVVPLLLWRDWRWIRVYVLALGMIFLGVWGVNGSACVADCFLHVLPSMSNGVPSLVNRSVMSACQVFYAVVRTGSVTKVHIAIPHAIGVVGKALELLVLGAATALIWRARGEEDRRTRTVILSLLPLLSTLTSPVSWEHAYAVALLPFAVLWTEAVRQRVPSPYLLLLSVCSLELNWFVLGAATQRFLHGIPLGLTVLFPLLCGISLVLYRLGAISRFAALRTTVAKEMPAALAA